MGLDIRSRGTKEITRSLTRLQIGHFRLNRRSRLDPTVMPLSKSKSPVIYLQKVSAVRSSVRGILSPFGSSRVLRFFAFVRQKCILETLSIVKERISKMKEVKLVRE